MKIYALLICCCLPSLLNAQITKGTVLIGGDVGISGSKYKNENPAYSQYVLESQSYSINPSAGWAVKENLVVGGRLIFNFSDYEQQSSPNLTSKNHNIGAGIFIRKYQPLGKSFYLFGDAGVGAQSVYRLIEPLQQPFNYKETGYAISATIFPGIAYQVNRHFLLEVALNNLLSVGYEHKNTEDRNAGGNNYKGVNNSYHITSSLSNGVPLQVGVRWMIAKK